ncbi:hypothetical protein [Saccharopolyspora shandongensis]|uniref:hypothetical protein n=1 Tax=Saccharopolyspora shandongensis TaxID=418495 RepID=UPI0033F88743
MSVLGNGSPLQNGYTVRDSGLLVRKDGADSYLPANFELETIPQGIQAVPPMVPPPPLPVAYSAPTSENDAEPVSRTVQKTRKSARKEAQLSEIADPKISEAERKLERAARLEQLADDPRAEAYNNRRTRSRILWGLAGAAGGGAILSAIFSALSITTALKLAGGAWFSASMLPDLLMGALMAIGLGMRSILAQRGLEISEASHQAYRKADKVLTVLIAVITVGPSIGALIYSIVLWAKFGGPAADVGWALVSVAVHSIGPVVVWLAAYLAPAVTGDWAKITAKTAERMAIMLTTSDNVVNVQVSNPQTANAATSNNGQFSQVNGSTAATSENTDHVIVRAVRELPAGKVSGGQVGSWHRKNIGPIAQERISQIRDEVNTVRGFQQ